MRFWDSSAIVPLLVEHAASATVDHWLSADPDVSTWTLTPVEITSALWRLVREAVLAEDEARRADQRVLEFMDASHTIVDVDAVKALGQRLVRVHALRAADALQLGAALLWCGGRTQGKVLHTLDGRLALAARREGFQVP